MNSKSASIKEPWLFYLDEEYIPCEKGTIEHDVALIIKDMLLSNDSEDAAPTAARQLHTYYCDRNLEHDTLVQLVAELYRLPAGPATAFNGGRLVIPGEPMFADMLENAWSENFVTDTRERKTSSSEFTKECEQWVNLSSFIARCINARIDDHCPDIAKYPSIDIPEGLEKDIPPGIKRDTRVMVAAQHILLAGRVIDEELVQGDSLGLNKWQLWAEKLKGLTEKELAPTVKTEVAEARNKLISIHPGLFPTSEVGKQV